MSPENFVKAQIAQFAFEEVGHMGGFNQMLAVACILRNRVRKGWHGGNWIAVLNTAKESAAFDPGPRIDFDLSSAAFRRVLQEIDEIYTGMFNDDLTNEGLYYFDTLHNEQNKTVRPWFAEKIIRDPANHPRIAQVGMLYIYA